MLGGSACYQEAQAHQDREDWGGHGGQPQPEVRADIFALGKVLDSCLQPAAHVVQSCQSARPLAGCWQGTAAPSSQSLAIWVLPSSCITAGLQGGCRQVETQRRLRQPGQVPSAYDLRSAHLSIHDLARWQFCRQTQSPALTQTDHVQAFPRDHALLLSKSLQRPMRGATSGTIQVQGAASSRKAGAWCTCCLEQSQDWSSLQEPGASGCSNNKGAAEHKCAGCSGAARDRLPAPAAALAG